MIIIGIDASNIKEGGGITHLSELLSCAEPTMHNFKKIVVWGRRETVSHLPERHWVSYQSEPALEKNAFVRILWQKYMLPRRLKELGCDLLFSPGGTVVTKILPSVAMSRNMIPFDDVEIFRSGISVITLKMILLRLFQQRTFRNVDGLIFLNDYAKRVIIEKAGQLKARTVIIPHGVSESFLGGSRIQQHLQKFSVKQPYRLIYVSHLIRYKHQWNVVRAIAILRAQGFPIIIEFIGAKNSSFKRFQNARLKYDPDNEFSIWHGHKSREELVDIYRNADAAVFASTCENLPNTLLEKMASGLPIACSNKSPMPDILGDNAVYFDAEDPMDIAEAVKRMIESVELRTRISKQVRDLAMQYTWEKTTNDTFRFLNLIAQTDQV